VGNEAGDVITLDGPNVDCFAYHAKDGSKYQFTAIDSQAWHAFSTANHYTIGVEFEGSGEPWTLAQYNNAVELMAFLCDHYNIPVRKTDPSGHDMNTFRGLFDHRDLTFGGLNVDGNNHTDGARPPGGWKQYLEDISAYMKPTPIHVPNFRDLPFTGSLRLRLAGKLYSGWAQATPAIVWVAVHGAKDPDCMITFKGPKAAPSDKPGRWDGPTDVTNVCIRLMREFRLDERN
jgi:hypothetical protein